MGCTGSVAATGLPRETQQMYLNPQEVVIRFSGQRKHVAYEELAFVSQHDTKVTNPGDEVYIVCTEWMIQWKQFVGGNEQYCHFHSQINNESLVDPFNEFKMRSNAKFKEEYRVVAKELWEYYFELYGGGPVLLFYVPSGLHSEAYTTASWLKDFDIPEIVTVIQPRARLELCTSINDGYKTRTIANNEIARVTVHTMKESAAKCKLSEVATLQRDADVTNKKIVISFLRDKKEEKAKDVVAYSVKLIQSVFRRHLVRLMVHQMKLKRQLIRVHAAVLLQSRWRLKRAKQIVSSLRRELAVREKAQLSCCLTLQNALRCSLARIRLNRNKNRQGRVWEVNLLETRLGSIPKVVTNPTFIVLSVISNGPHGSSISTYQSKCVETALSMEWFEEAVLAGKTGGDEGTLLVSVLQRVGLSMDSAEVLGQALINLKDFPLLRTYQPVDMCLNLRSYTYGIKKDNGRQVIGTIINQPVDVNDGTHQGKWDQEWIVLCDMVIYSYKSPNEVGTLLSTVECGSVTMISQSVARGYLIYSLAVASGDSSAVSFNFRFTDEETGDVIEMWKRKISRSCGHLTGENVFPVDVKRQPKQHLGPRNASLLGSVAIKRTVSGRVLESHSVNAVRRMSATASCDGERVVQRGGTLMPPTEEKRRSTFFSFK